MVNLNVMDLGNDMSEMDHGLKEMNKMDYGLREIKMKCDQ